MPSTATRVPVAILSGIGLLNFPIGTLINAYILYLVFSAKGQYVLSRPYAEIIRQTPHVRYRSSALLIVLLIIIGLIVAAVVTFAWLGTQ